MPTHEPNWTLFAAALLTPMLQKQAPQLPSVLDLCPRLRRRARRAAIEVHHLVDHLGAAFPDAAFLAREPRAAEWMDTTPYDHVVADFIAVAHAICNAISALDDPS
jgi:hypothetical protein